LLLTFRCSTLAIFILSFLCFSSSVYFCSELWFWSEWNQHLYTRCCEHTVAFYSLQNVHACINILCAQTQSLAPHAYMYFIVWERKLGEGSYCCCMWGRYTALQSLANLQSFLSRGKNGVGNEKTLWQTGIGRIAASLTLMKHYLPLHSPKTKDRRMFETKKQRNHYLHYLLIRVRLCGLVVGVSDYRSRCPSSIPGDTRFSEKYWVWNGVHSAS
jgi:hypothetical protein